MTESTLTTKCNIIDQISNFTIGQEADSQYYIKFDMGYSYYKGLLHEGLFPDELRPNFIEITKESIEYFGKISDKTPKIMSRFEFADGETNNFLILFEINTSYVKMSKIIKVGVTKIIKTVDQYILEQGQQINDLRNKLISKDKILTEHDKEISSLNNKIAELNKQIEEISKKSDNNLKTFIEYVSSLNLNHSQTSQFKGFTQTPVPSTQNSQISSLTNSTSSFTNPVPSFTNPVPSFTNPVPSFTNPVPSFTNPVSSFTNPVPSFTNLTQNLTSQNNQTNLNIPKSNITLSQPQFQFSLPQNKPSISKSNGFVFGENIQKNPSTPETSVTGILAKPTETSEQANDLTKSNSAK